MTPNPANPEPTARDRYEIPLDEARFCVLDTETTGLKPGVDQVVEVAVVHASLRAGVVHHESCLVNPGRPIPAEATEIHGLRDEDVADAGTLQDAMALTHLHPFDAWVAHNVNFDFGFVEAGDIPVLCTLRLARRLWPELPEHKNQSLRAHWNLETPEADGLPAHRAEPDALVTSALLRLELTVLQERFPEIRTLGQLLDWMATPYLLPCCVIGHQHRGKAWSEVPQSYMSWALENFDGLDLDLRTTLQHHLGN